MLSGEEKAAAAAVRAAHFIVNEDLPLVKFKPLIGLLNDLETPHISKLNVSAGVSYVSSWSFFQL